MVELQLALLISSPFPRLDVFAHPCASSYAQIAFLCYCVFEPAMKTFYAPVFVALQGTLKPKLRDFGLGTFMFVTWDIGAGVESAIGAGKWVCSIFFARPRSCPRSSERSWNPRRLLPASIHFFLQTYEDKLAYIVPFCLIAGCTLWLISGWYSESRIDRDIPEPPPSRLDDAEEGDRLIVSDGH